MQPKTTIHFDPNTFKRMMKTIKNKAETNRKKQRDPSYATEQPEEVGIQLNNTCNLRCAHCFQWNDQGFFNAMTPDQKKEQFDIRLLDKVLHETAQSNANLYLWGGEPLVYYA